MPHRCGSPVGGDQRALSYLLALCASPPPCQVITLSAAAAPKGISIESGAVSSEKDVLCITAPKRCSLGDLRIAPLWLLRTTSLPWLRKRHVAASHMRREGARDTTTRRRFPLETQDVRYHRARYLGHYN